LQLPKLYKSEDGVTRTYEISTENNIIVVSTGTTTTTPKIRRQSVTKLTSETNLHLQAESEARKKWIRKIKEGYLEEPFFIFSGIAQGKMFRT